jgi:hypothetical protein
MKLLFCTWFAALLVFCWLRRQRRRHVCGIAVAPPLTPDQEAVVARMLASVEVA